MHFHRVTLLTLTIILLHTVAVYSNPVPPLSRELESLMVEGLLQNRQLQSLAAQVEQFNKQIGFAGSLDDPRIGFGVLNLPTDTFSFNQEPMTQKQISFAQKLPLFGKLDLKSKRAATLALRQEFLYQAKRLEVARQISADYYELLFVRKSLETNSNLTDLVSGLLKVAETRYATGKGLQQDVLQAQVELSKLLDEKISLNNRERALEDRINSLLSRERFSAVETGALPVLNELRLELNRLQQIGLEQNKTAAAKRVEIEQAMLEIELARKGYWPDMDLRFAYGQRDEDLTGRDLPDFVSGQVVFNVPLWKNKRQDNQLAAARERHQAAEKAYQAVIKSLPFRIDTIVRTVHDAQENLQLFREALLVQASSWAESALVSYEVGKLEFNTMIGAQMRQLRFELQAMRLQMTIMQKLAELDEILGQLPVDVDRKISPEGELIDKESASTVKSPSAHRNSLGQYWGVK